METNRTIKPNVDDGMVSSIFSIPNLILMQILSKLPVSTIRNCRCVCSCFRNLISDPQFAQLHLSSSQPSLMLRSYYCREEFPMHFVESIDPLTVDGSADIWISNNTTLKFKPKFDLRPTEGFEDRSSCNGLICFSWPRTYNPYVICNPVINEYVIVPQIQKDNFHHCGSGFGFSPRTNQYKVLRLLSPKIGYGSKFEAEINTLGTNLWRRVGDAPRYVWYSRYNCFFNGALHWIIHDTNYSFESMCCFNFEKEQFEPFPGPPQFCGLPGQLWVDKMKMGVLNDVLSVFYRPTSDILEIWVMKNYAVQESWTKNFIEIPRIEELRIKDYHPLMVLNNEDILMYCTSSYYVLSWNMRTKGFRKVRFNGIISLDGAMTYIPSFVSIKNAATGKHS